MLYIPRVDEILVPPAYLLGTSERHIFESNLFVIPARNETLQELLDEQLNAAFPDGPVRYRVPASVQTAYVAFFRYQRAASESEPKMGWMSYTEMMIGVLCLREFLDNSMRPEWVTYLGVVYIDSSNYSGTSVDPYSIPIIVGRESYGLPKNPARVFYEPQLGQPQRPKLELWDVDSKNGRLSPQTALRVYSKPLDPLVASGPTGTPRDPFPNRGKFVPRHVDAHEFYPIAMGLGIDPHELDVSESDHHPQASDIGIPGEDGSGIGWKGLLWGTKLVGLKQFVDPQSKPDSRTGLGEACYQAAVESPIEELKGHKLPGPSFVAEPQILEFPEIERVDLIKVFGLQETSPRHIEVGQDAMFYQQGQLCFATPNKVSVWNPGHRYATS